MAKRKVLITGAKVLITGATGYIASQLLPRFREIYDLTLIDVKNTDPTGAKVPGATIADLNRYRELFRGIDTVVHLGFHRGPGRSAGTYTINTYKATGPMSTGHTTCLRWRTKKGRGGSWWPARITPPIGGSR
jgi:nucleoside-diphosphate-sugar epimerase